VPGALNPDVTSDTIHQTICVPGYTKTIRPPVSYTDAIKRRLMQEQHLAGRAQDYELDHLVPIEGGGHPRSLDNLWMQPLAEARVKDADENRMHRAICDGRVTLRAAQAALFLRWGPKASRIIFPCTYARRMRAMRGPSRGSERQARSLVTERTEDPMYEIHDALVRA
jgi:hypothetical protein